MSNEYCGNSENAPMPSLDELNLLEVMDICSDLYLTHLLAVEILGYRSEHFSELGENPWIVSILEFEEKFFFKLGKIH